MYSIILPIDSNRLEQFKETYKAYKALDFKEDYEFIMPTREYEKVKQYFDTHNIQATLIPYEYKNGFNPSMALNIGVRNAKYNNIIISSPEVKPITNILKQLQEYIGENIICQVYDETENGTISMSLVNSNFRSGHPGYYFLALFQKKDIEQINGWDEEFMKGYAWEDDDFGHRFNRAGLKFSVKDNIIGLHQYHPRTETTPNGWSINKKQLDKNDANMVIWADKGLK